MGQYTIFPVRGSKAKEYLAIQGCSVGRELMHIPDYLKEHPVTSDGVTFALIHPAIGEVFRMEFHQPRTWRVLVPPQYRVPFPELIRAYSTRDLWNAGVFCSYDSMCKLMQNIPVSSSIVTETLQRLSKYTGHPYDLNNVAVVLIKKREETVGAEDTVTS